MQNKPMNKLENSEGKMAEKHNHLIGAIDQGTSSTRFLVFENITGQLVASNQIEIKRIVPKEGWVEIEPDAIMDSVYRTISNVHTQLQAKGCDVDRLKCIGICNQRESTVVWDSQTGKPLYNVIVWMDNRTKDLVDNMIDSVPGRDFNWLKDKTGLPMSTYFSAFKLKWLIENVDEVKMTLKEDRLLFGTVDSWILWNLTGKHLTDVTNASRTFLMDIESLSWNRTLCDYFNIPIKILPKILSSADDFGSILKGPLKGLPITGVIGDQSAALFGHNCLQLGQTKATFGTGCFIMQNIGPGPLHGALSGVKRDAKRGLITTVGFKLRDKPACYALEGSVKIAGAALTWLRDNIQLIQNYEECDPLIDLVSHSAGVFFVPALGGLYSPYWDPNAAGLFIGLSQFTRREHLVRATYDSIAFQTNDILSLMHGVTNGLMIDGGLCKSENMCQILADITGCDIVRPSMCETSALGAAMIAGCGANIWSYEQMLANSETAYEYSSSSNQNHHYPHESLHYDDKFLSLIQSKSFPASVLHQLATADRTSSDNLDAGGGIIAYDAGGGTQVVDSVSNDSLDKDVQLITHTGGQQFVDKMRSYAPTSSGYSSTDNYELTMTVSDASSEQIHRDSPISSQVTDSSGRTDCCDQSSNNEQTIGDEKGKQEASQNQQARLETNRNSFISKNFPSNLSTCLRNYIYPSKGGDEYDFEDESVDEADDEGSYETNFESQNQYASKQDLIPHTRLVMKPVDIFQSYISLEHRTELVNTWKCAVERSMQWTKIHHEEIRRIDYQRLSSLPISMYLFFSIGMVALSGLVSANRGGTFLGL